RRASWILVAGLAVFAAIVATLGYQLLTPSPSTAAARIEVARRGALPSTVWPASGQAAVQIGQSRVQAGPNQHAAAIASVAKVMTAYVVLRAQPLRPRPAGARV